MSNVIDVLTNRRSIRRFKEQKIEQEKIDLITKAALMAPSSKRCRPWHFIVVTEKETLKALSECRPMGSAFIAGAAAAIVVLAEESKSDVWVEDASIAATHIILEANDLDLGACWVQVRNRQKDEKQSAEGYLRNLLSFPETLKAECIVALGYKDEEKKPFDDAHILTERIHYGKF